MKTMLAFLLGLGFSAGATAQADPADPAPPSSPEAIQAMHDFARCIAERKTDQARRLLATDFQSPERGDALRRIVVRTGCPAELTVRVNGRFLSARMAESLVLSRIGTRPLSDYVAHDPAQPALAARDESEMMSLCVVRAAPAEVEALFRTRPASDGESAAIRALSPRVGQCLAAGATGQFNRSGLRSMLGLAAYRLAEERSRTASAE